MKLIVTVFEATCDAALDAIRALPPEHDGVEVRAERFPSIDLQAIRAATDKPVILTYRGSRVPDIEAALDAGIDYIDVEWHDGVEISHPSRTVLSHHDYEGMRDVETIMARMRERECAYTKLAATPHNFADNERLLALLSSSSVSSRFLGSSGRGALGAPRSSEELRGTVIGMGERGLYARILAPFRGSELVFVAATTIAAPGQLTLERALEIYGRDESSSRQGVEQRLEDSSARRLVFAIVGNPAGHSLSPVIHNRLFREKNVPAAYTIASIASFDEIVEAFLRGEPCGLSVTAPFKEDAFALVRNPSPNAKRARAVNTLVKLGGEIIGDNTDVDGFAALIEGTKAAVIGAGATSRAAQVALADKGIPTTVYNRTVSKGDAPLDALRRFDGDLIINTLPPGVAIDVPQCRVYIEAAYGGGELRPVACERRFGGLDLLHAQAVRQHQLFMKVFE